MALAPGKPVFEDDCGELAPLAYAGPIAEEESGRRGRRVGERLLVAQPGVGDGLKLQRRERAVRDTRLQDAGQELAGVGEARRLHEGERRGLDDRVGVLAPVRKVARLVVLEELLALLVVTLDSGAFGVARRRRQSLVGRRRRGCRITRRRVDRCGSRRRRLRRRQ